MREFLHQVNESGKVKQTNAYNILSEDMPKKQLLGRAEICRLFSNLQFMNRHKNADGLRL